MRPSQSFHTAQAGTDGMVTAMGMVASSNVWINGGYLVLRRAIFDYMQDKDELVGGSVPRDDRPTQALRLSI